MRIEHNFTADGEVVITQRGFDYGVTVYGDLGGGALKLLDSNDDVIDTLSSGYRQRHMLVTATSKVVLTGASSPNIRLTVTQLT